MRGCGSQFMDHMRSVSWQRLQILSLASEVDRLKKSSGNKYALLVDKTNFSMLRMGPLWPRAPLRIGVSSYAMAKPAVGPHWKTLHDNAFQHGLWVNTIRDIIAKSGKKCPVHGRRSQELMREVYLNSQVRMMSWRNVGFLLHIRPRVLAKSEIIR